MAYDTALEARVDEITADWQLSKKKMFGSMAYFEHGSMLFAVRDDELLFKTSPENVANLLQTTGYSQAVMGQRVMKNWLQAGGEAIAADEDLLKLLETCRTFIGEQDQPPSRSKSMPF